MPSLSKSIIIPRDLIADTQQVQQLSLFFEDIIVWPLDRRELDKSALLAIRERNIDLAEAEMTAPGREVSYFTKIEKNLGLNST